jgi:hypothetical protein
MNFSIVGSFDLILFSLIRSARSGCAPVIGYSLLGRRGIKTEF